MRVIIETSLHFHNIFPQNFAMCVSYIIACTLINYVQKYEIYTSYSAFTTFK